MSPNLVPTLSELRVELGRLQSISVRAWSSITGEPGSPEHDARCDAAEDASGAVDGTIAAIAELPAASLADLRVKAYALDFVQRTTDALEAPSQTDQKLARQIVMGLLDERIA